MYTEVSKIFESLNAIKEGKNNIPPTMLYCEGWMLRLVLHWFSLNNKVVYKLKFSENAHWYSEALLSSPFSPLYRGDPLSESWTHADGVIGHFSIGNNGFGDLKISEGCKQFVVIEAKMFSKYSKGTKNAKDYNQATRTVACMSNILVKSLQKPKDIDNIAFYTFLPLEQIENEPTFKEYINKENILTAVKNRVDSYKGRADYNTKHEWFENHFLSFTSSLNTELISWEEIIELIQRNDSIYGKDLQSFYQNCIIYNRRFKDEEGAETAYNSV